MGHGGPEETSLVQHLDADLVREDRLDDAAEGSADGWGEWVSGVNLAYDSDEFSENGTVGDPREASAERGERLLDDAGERHWRPCSGPSKSGTCPDRRSQRPLGLTPRLPLRRQRRRRRPRRRPPPRLRSRPRTPRLKPAPELRDGAGEVADLVLCVLDVRDQFADGLDLLGQVVGVLDFFASASARSPMVYHFFRVAGATPPPAKSPTSNEQFVVVQC